MSTNTPGTFLLNLEVNIRSICKALANIKLWLTGRAKGNDQAPFGCLVKPTIVSFSA